MGWRAIDFGFIHQASRNIRRRSSRSWTFRNLRDSNSQRGERSRRLAASRTRVDVTPFRDLAWAKFVHVFRRIGVIGRVVCGSSCSFFGANSLGADRGSSEPFRCGVWGVSARRRQLSYDVSMRRRLSPMQVARDYVARTDARKLRSSPRFRLRRLLQPFAQKTRFRRTPSCGRLI